jgi:hypothetical protein
MSNLQRGLILAVVMLVLGSVPATAADFYEIQLRLGAEAFRTGRMSDAIDHLKIANFGFLDRPVLLVEGLSRLALAQDAAGLRDDMTKTLQRFVDVERQFPSWASAGVDAELRRRFEQLLRAGVSRELLSGIPSLAPIGPSQDDGVAELTGSARRKYLENKARAEPANAAWPLLLAEDELRGGNLKASLRWADRALEIDSGLIEARVIRLGILTQRKEWASASRELQRMSGRPWDDFPRVYADAFVVYTQLNDFERADPLYPRIPRELVARPDVAQAAASFRRRESSRLEEQAMRDVDPADEAMVEPDKPAAAPVKAAEGPVDARISSPRGSFTSPRDPVAEALAVAVRLIGEGRPADAQLVVRDAIRSNPESRELRLAMLEASCLASDWRTGMSQLLLIEPFRSGEEKYMFYGAVVYHESEKPDDARRLMTVALPKLARNSYVDHYARLVMGE